MTHLDVRLDRIHSHRAKRGLRFPKWQVNSDGGMLPQLSRLFTGVLTRTALTNYENQ
jgi:hypothetical protein